VIQILLNEETNTRYIQPVTNNLAVSAYAFAASDGFMDVTAIALNTTLDNVFNVLGAATGYAFVDERNAQNLTDVPKPTREITRIFIKPTSAGTLDVYNLDMSADIDRVALPLTTTMLSQSDLELAAQIFAGGDVNAALAGLAALWGLTLNDTRTGI